MRREPLLLAALALLCCGTMVNLGELSVAGIAFIVAAIAVAVLALRASDGGASNVEWAAALVLCALMLPVLTARTGPPAETLLAIVVIAGGCGIVLAHGRIRVALMALTPAAIVAMTVLPWHFGHADIDVFTSVQQAANAVLHGQNPYSTTFITANQVTPDLFVAERVHFQYLPGVALLAAPARLLGDVRLMAAVATLALFAAAIWLARQSPDSQRRTLRTFALCCALPVSVLMVVNAWVDVYAVAGFAGWLALRRSHPRLAMMSLALALLVKPTILVALVPFAVWSRSARRQMFVSAIAAGAVILPFALATGFTTFYHDVAGVQAQLGFRYDGLTLSALVFSLTSHLPPLWTTLPVGLSVAWIVLRQPPRDLGDLLLMGAVLSAAAFLLAKWAFFNYYFIPIWLLSLAIAARGIPAGAAEDVALPAPVHRLRIPKRAARVRPGQLRGAGAGG